MDTKFGSDPGERNPVTDPNLDQDPPRQGQPALPVTPLRWLSHLQHRILP